MAVIRTRNDPRLPLALALTMLGAPCFAFPYAHGVAVVLVLNAVRGVGFGFLGVLLGSAVMLSAPPGRRGLVLGLFGLITSGLAALGQSGALALEGALGFQATFTLAGGVTLAALLPVIATRNERAEHALRPAVISRQAEQLLVLAIVFLLVATTYGAVVSFVPERMHAQRDGDAVTFFLVLAITMPAGRLTTGWLLDRLRSKLPLLLAIIAGAAGLAVLALGGSVPASFGAPTLYGLSFGALSTGVQATMSGRVGPADYNVVNGLFNAAWNAGMATGGLGLGLLSEVAGYADMFLVAAALMGCGGLALLVDRQKAPFTPVTEVLARR